MHLVLNRVLYSGEEGGLLLRLSWRRLPRFVTHRGNKYQLSGNEIRQVKPNHARAVAPYCLKPQQTIPYAIGSSSMSLFTRSSSHGILLADHWAAACRQDIWGCRNEVVVVQRLVSLGLRRSWPHSEQNLLSEGFVFPHCGHAKSSLLPHLLQNFAPSGCSASHFRHFIGTLYLTFLKKSSPDPGRVT
jgi:hypothetical protein